MRQIPFVCDHYRLNDPVPNFSDYDLIYLGGGADMEQRMLSSDLLRCKDGLKKAYADGVFFLMICGGYQLMGKFYRDADGNELPGLGLFNYYTIAPHSRRKRCIGNIIIRTQLTGEPLEVVGFENHGGQTHDVSSPFGTVLYGNGNQFQCQEEGYCEKNSHCNLSAWTIALQKSKAIRLYFKNLSGTENGNGCSVATAG